MIDLKLTEYLEMSMEEMAIVYKKEILGEIVSRDEKDLEVMHSNMCAYSIAENDNNGIETEDGRINERREDNANNNESNAESTNTNSDENQIFQFSNKIPNEIFKLNSIGSTEDWRKQDAEAKNREVFKDIVTTYDEVTWTFKNMFLLIAILFWNRKIEDGIDKMQNVFCQHSLDLDNAIGIAEATSEAVAKEKFVLRGNIHSAARDEARKQCNRDFARMKDYLSKKLVLFNEKIGKKNDNKGAHKQKKHQNQNQTNKKEKPKRTPNQNNNNNNGNKKTKDGSESEDASNREYD